MQSAVGIRNNALAGALISYIGSHACRLGGPSLSSVARVGDLLFRSSLLIGSAAALYCEKKGVAPCRYNPPVRQNKPPNPHPCRAGYAQTSIGLFLTLPLFLPKKLALRVEQLGRIVGPTLSLINASGGPHPHSTLKVALCFSLMVGSDLIGRPGAESLVATTLLPLGIFVDLWLWPKYLHTKR